MFSKHFFKSYITTGNNNCSVNVYSYRASVAASVSALTLTMMFGIGPGAIFEHQHQHHSVWTYHLRSICSSQSANTYYADALCEHSLKLYKDPTTPNDYVNLTKMLTGGTFDMFAGRRDE